MAKVRYGKYRFLKAYSKRLIIVEMIPQLLWFGGFLLKMKQLQMK